MLQVVMVDANITNIADIVRIKSVIDNGGVVALPTDTIYGLATNLQNYEKIIELKKRDGKPLAILCSNIEQMQQIIELNKNALKVALKFTPGALTLVGHTIDDCYAINPGYDTTGVRIPNHNQLQQLLEVTGPLVVSSANLSNGPETYIVEDVYKIFKNKIDLYVDNDRECSKEASVVLDATTFQVYRSGKYVEEILQFIKKLC